MIEIREYQDRGDHSPFRDWFVGLNSAAARKVTTTLYRVGLGNLSSVKSVGGGTKQRQQNDISLAVDRWDDYKRRKKLQRDGG